MPRAARAEVTQAEREQMEKVRLWQSQSCEDQRKLTGGRILQEQAERDAAEAERLRILKHSDRHVEASEGGVKAALDTDSLLAEFKNLATYSSGTGGDGGDGGFGGGRGGWAIGQRPAVETEKLRKQMEPLELRSYVASPGTRFRAADVSSFAAGSSRSSQSVSTRWSFTPIRSGISCAHAGSAHFRRRG